jgi:aryl-alcohol dehydrogenase-like predicted oxidoreductase
MAFDRQLVEVVGLDANDDRSRWPLVRTRYGVHMTSDGHTLEGTDVSIPLLGVGTWSWGDRSTWGMGGYDTHLTRASIQEAWNASIDAGVTLFDTAEVYGRGESERIIGELLAGDPGRAASVVVATKFMPSPWKLQVRCALMKSLRLSLGRSACRRSISTRSTALSAFAPTRRWPMPWPPPTKPAS